MEGVGEDGAAGRGGGGVLHVGQPLELEDLVGGGASRRQAACGGGRGLAACGGGRGLAACSGRVMAALENRGLTACGEASQGPGRGRRLATGCAGGPFLGILEGVAVADVVVAGVEEVAEGAAGVGGEGGGEVAVLELGEEIGEAAVGRWLGRQEAQGGVEGLAGRRGDGEAVDGEDDLQPFESPEALRRVAVDMGERLEADGADGEVVVAGGGGVGEEPAGVADVEAEDLGARVAQELGDQEVEERALAGAGRADDEGVADVVVVEV